MNISQNPARNAPANTFPLVALPAQTSANAATGAVQARAQRVLRNTYALLSMTLLFSAAAAALSVAAGLPAPGLVLMLVGSFGLLWRVHKLQHSGWAVPAVFAFTGFMGYSLGPVLNKTLALPGGAQVVMLALAATGVTFLALSAWVLATRRDFSAMSGFLFRTGPSE